MVAVFRVRGGDAAEAGSMTWVRIDDHATTHPKLRDAGAEAAWLWVCGLAWCNGQHTNGTIRKADVGVLYPDAAGWSRKRAERAAERLVAVRLWHDEGAHWRVHDYAVYQEEATREVVEDRQQYERERKARQRAAKRAAIASGVPPGVPDIVPDTVPGDTARDMSPGTVPGTPLGTPAEDSVSAGGVNGKSATVPTPRPTVPSDPTVRPVCDPDTRAANETEANCSSEPLRWGAWLRWRAEAGKADDPPINRQHLEIAWQAVERELAARLEQPPAVVFERLCRAYLSWPSDTPLPGGKAAPRGDRPASWLPSGVHQLTAHALGNGDGKSQQRAETERLRAEAARQKAARLAGGGVA